MACGGCAARKSARSGVEYLVKHRDGRRETVPDIPTARRVLALGSGGTYEAVAKAPQ